MTQLSLGFDGGDVRVERLGPASVVLRHFASDVAEALLADVARVAETAPFRHLETPGGGRMSAAMTNCGERGWVSDRSGYRYAPTDPLSGRAWAPLPASFADVAARAALAAGFDAYAPDACLVNRYEPGAKMGLHVDKDERDAWSPIVSVSLGLPATFLWGGATRGDPTQKIALEHGDVVVWGGPDRMRLHGVATIRAGAHPATGTCRINLTFRVTGL